MADSRKVYTLERRNSKALQAGWDYLGPTLDVLKEKAKTHGPQYRTKPRGGVYGKPGGLGTMLHDVESLGRKAGEGDVFWIECADKVIFVIRTGVWHLKQPPKPPAGISPAVVAIHDFIFTEVQKLAQELGRPLHIVTMGYTVCKWISGYEGRVASQHCPGDASHPPQGGNAMNFIIRGANGKNDIEAMDKITPRVTNLPACSEVGWRNWPNHYPFHEHASGAPKRTGIPGCLR